MLTAKQIERMWHLKAFNRLIDELSCGRAEAIGGIRQLIDGPAAAAALTVIRLTELNQGHHPLVNRMVRFLIASQSPEGGFGDAVTTALCLRALSAGAGSGAVLEAGVAYLSKLQKQTGEWTREPMSRLPGDPAVTAFVLLQMVESHLPGAKALIDQTLDRLIADDEAPRDRQLTTLRRRVAARTPELAACWS